VNGIGYCQFNKWVDLEEGYNQWGTKTERERVDGEDETALQAKTMIFWLWQRNRFFIKSLMVRTKRNELWVRERRRKRLNKALTDTEKLSSLNDVTSSQNLNRLNG
jgi:hypothetical protein